jgi:hypothetical protein
MASTDPATYGYDVLLADLNKEFRSLKTHDVEWRKKQLRGMLTMMKENHELVAEAVLADIPNPKMRAVLDFSFVGGLKLCLAELDKWTKPVSVTRRDFDGSAQYLHVPKGVVLILSPFNFPFELAMGPLVSAIAAGNCAVIKPSELTPRTSALIAELLPKYVDPSCVKVIEGGIPETTALLKLKVSERQEKEFGVGVCSMVGDAGSSSRACVQRFIPCGDVYLCVAVFQFSRCPSSTCLGRTWAMCTSPLVLIVVCHPTLLLCTHSYHH